MRPEWFVTLTKSVKGRQLGQDSLWPWYLCHGQLNTPAVFLEKILYLCYLHGAMKLPRTLVTASLQGAMKVPLTGKELLNYIPPTSIGRELFNSHGLLPSKALLPPAATTRAA